MKSNNSKYIEALKTALSDFIWPYSLVGAPAVYFGFKAPFFEQGLFFFSGALILFFIYLAICFITHRIKLRNKTYASKFEAMSTSQQGKSIGGLLGGW